MHYLFTIVSYKVFNVEVKPKLTERQIKQHKNKILGRLAMAAKQAKDSGGKPFILNFSTTLKCNCNCESCLWKDNSATNEMTAEEIKRIHMEAKDEGFQLTILWGGEPTLRRDLADIIKFIKTEANFGAVVLVSNGYLLPKRISEFGDYLDVVLLSLDSPLREEHDKIRGLPGLYDRIMDSVDIIRRDYPLISLQFSFSISKYNIHHVDEMIALGERLNVPIAFNVINTIRHYSTGDIDEKGTISATDEEISDAFSRVLEAKRNGSPVLNSEMYLKHFIGGKKPYRCHVKKAFMYVFSNGDIEDCLQLDKPLANLRQISLKEAMKLPRFKKFLKDTEKCDSCNSPTMIDCSYVWEDWSLLTKSGGITFG